MALTITAIPDRYRPGLAKIKDLPAETVSAITVALSKVPVSSIKEMTAAAETAGALSTADAEAIITALRSLYMLRASSESSVPEFVSILIGAMQVSGRKDLAVSDEDKPRLTEKLTSLLSSGSLELASKIEQLKLDHPSIFHDAKIMSDLRPVFAEPTDPPIGYIIGHTLKIISHEHGAHKELYFALDLEDINTLKKIAERAEQKASSLKAVINATNTRDFS